MEMTLVKSFQSGDPDVEFEYHGTEVAALQRQNTEISIQIFPEKEYRDLIHNFHIHASVCDLYLPTIGHAFSAVGNM